MDFLANENFPLLSARLLREAGHRVVSIIVPLGEWEKNPRLQAKTSV